MKRLKKKSLGNAKARQKLGRSPMDQAADLVKTGVVRPGNTPPINPSGTMNLKTAQAVQGGGTPPIPPFAPDSPEAWMKLGAARAWEKFPERTMNLGMSPPPYPVATDPITPGAPEMPSHDSTVISAQRVMQFLLSRFNPNRGLTPQTLATYLDQWQLGFLRWLALSWDRMSNTDDQIKAVRAKREFSVARLKWEIFCDDPKDPEAVTQKEALQAFYNNLTCTHCLDQNEKGGVGLLIRQMMHAIGDKWAVHEIVWSPFADEKTGEIQYTANFRFVPLWFFENRTGQLRYLPYELALDGIPLDAGGWLVTVGDGLNFATAIAYMFKQLGLKDWARYSEKFGVPTIIGKAAASFGSSEFNEMVSALTHLNSDGVIVINKLNDIEAFDAPSGTGELPQEKLCDRMDRAIARLWRGGDLSTMSRGGSGGVGALPQIQQEDEIAEADCIRLSETLNVYVDSWVIRYKFGAARQKAHFRIIPSKNIDNDKEIKTFQFALASGVPISVKSIQEKFDLTAPKEGEELAKPPPMPGANPGGAPDDAASLPSDSKIVKMSGA